jgi:hypothetical protein
MNRLAGPKQQPENQSVRYEAQRHDGDGQEIRGSQRTW